MASRLNSVRVSATGSPARVTEWPFEVDLQVGGADQAGLVDAALHAAEDGPDAATSSRGENGLAM